jgi:hypothetical protein
MQVGFPFFSWRVVMRRKLLLESVDALPHEIEPLICYGLTRAPWRAPQDGFDSRLCHSLRGACLEVDTMKLHQRIS